MHLWPLLALIEHGIGTESHNSFTESDDYAFWDRYFRLPGDVREPRDEAGAFTQDYYVEPLLSTKKPSDYPHRSPNTIRTRTFLNSWKAAEVDPEDSTLWKLTPSFADTFASKVLRRENVFHRVPTVDLAIWLFREFDFKDDATSKTLETLFLERFPFSSTDYDTLFQYTEESANAIFTSERPSDESLAVEIESALLNTTAAPPEPEPLYAPGVQIDEDDAILRQVRELIALGSSGVILRGCPGTGKTWYAKQVARHLVDDPSCVYQVQFHASYGYEDFVEGYRPDENTKSGFKLVNKLFLDACSKADNSTTVVLIIDEINRGDPSRILGELLTYVEHGYRNEPFQLAHSGSRARVPENLVILGTMNTSDKSIAQLDSALLRRFDHIDLSPSSEIVETFLLRSGEFDSDQSDAISGWFESVQDILPLGHTYFKDVLRPEHLRTIWNYRILPYCEAILELEPDKVSIIKNRFDAMYRRVLGQTEGEGVP